MTDDLWGEVPWLLRKWEIPSIGASLYLFVKPAVLTLSFSYFSLLTYLAISDHPALEEHYQGRV